MAFDEYFNEAPATLRAKLPTTKYLVRGSEWVRPRPRQQGAGHHQADEVWARVARHLFRDLEGKRSGMPRVGSQWNFLRITGRARSHTTEWKWGERPTLRHSRGASSTTAPIAHLWMLTQPAPPVTALSDRLASLLMLEPGDCDLRRPNHAWQNHLQELSDLVDRNVCPTWQWSHFRLVLA
jgi:hypothetical protein